MRTGYVTGEHNITFFIMQTSKKLEVNLMHRSL